MPLDAVSPRRAVLADRLAGHWRAPLLRLALAWAALFALFAGDWVEMAGQWWNSSTYNHILFVPPILAWLVYQRAGELARLEPRAWWPGLLPMGGALLVWLLGDISGLATATHLGVVVMAQAAVLTLLGPRISWALLFPLAYALFLVPIGDELVPALQMVTAAITIALTEASGIPAHIQGVFIDTPAGLFEVAEACSGVKFLIAMIALGMLVAHVCFRSWTRRAVFLTLAVVLPIVANGIRAWGTIYIAQSQGIGFAAGFDHIFYGWIFFALVMAMLLGIGWRFFDRGIDEPFIDADRIAATRWIGRLERFSAKGWHAFAALLAMAVLTIAWSSRAHGVEADLPQAIALPPVPGWQARAYAPVYPWQPRMGGADRTMIGSYQDAQGRRVDVAFALYAAQEDGREAGAYGEGALVPGTEWSWLSDTTAPDGTPGIRLQALGSHQRVAETWYRHGDWVGTSALQLKLLAMRDRLLLRERATSMAIVSIESAGGGDETLVLEDFRNATCDLGKWMDRAGRGG